MTSSLDRDWRLLPDLALADIMLMVGLDSLESLHRCRQVCRTWNEKIMTNIWGNQAKKNKIKAKIKQWGLGEMIPSNEDISHLKWLENRGIINIFNDVYLGMCENFRILSRSYPDFSSNYDSTSEDEQEEQEVPLSITCDRESIYYKQTNEEEFACFASLAHHADLSFDVEEITLRGVRLDYVPDDHLTSLFSRVTGEVTIDNVSVNDLVSILDSIECKVLRIENQAHHELSETMGDYGALAQAIERAEERCKEVEVDGWVQGWVQEVT